MSTRSDKMKARWADPAYRARQDEIRKARWANPESRKKQAEVIKSINAKKRLAKQQAQEQQIKPTGHIISSGVVVPTQSSVLGYPNRALVHNILEQQQAKPKLEKLLEELETDETPEVQQVVTTKIYRFGDHH